MKRNRKQLRVTQLAAALALVLFAVPRAGWAYGLTGVGGSVGYANPADLNGTAAVGIHAELEQQGARLHLDPNVRYWNIDGVSDVAPNMDATYHFMPDNHWTPYVGGGLGVNFVHDRGPSHSDADVGLNVIGGVRFPGALNRYFVEGRYTASDINQVSLVTGITFRAP